MTVRKATIKDLPHIVEMLADDGLGKARENFELPLPEAYRTAFQKIDSDNNQELIVVENDASEIIGTLYHSYFKKNLDTVVHENPRW